MASNPSPDLTRHQLDELDALLQRMLNLPLAPAPVPPAPAVAVPANWRADESAAPPRPPRVVPEHASWDEPEAHVIPAAERFAPPEARTLRGVDAPATPSGFAPVVIEEPEPVSLVGAPFEATPPTVPLLLWPLAALNAVLESVLRLFGPLGSWACKPGAKTLLGSVGVAMLIAGFAWAARGAGYLR